MAELLLRPLSVGEIIDHSLAIYRRQFVPLVMITLGANGIPLILTVYMLTSGGITQQPGLYIAITLLSIVLGALATAATVYLVSESYLGNSLTAGQAFGRATRFTGRLILLTMLMGLLVGLCVMVFLLPGALTGSPALLAVGMLAAFVPAIILVTGLLVSTPALVVEDISSSAAMSRSWQLTRGHRWKMLGLVIVVVIIVLIPSIAIAFVTGGLQVENLGEMSTGNIVWEVISQLITTLIYPLLYCALTIAYYDLRVRKEGFDLELLESTLAQALPQGRSSEIRDIPKPRTFG